MFGIDLSAGVQSVVALLIVLAMFIAFMRESYPVEVTAIGGVIVMLILGV